jgi:hypothetical protein
MDQTPPEPAKRHLAAVDPVTGEVPPRVEPEPPADVSVPAAPASPTPDDDGYWGLDAAVGAAALVGRLGTSAVGAVAGSGPGRMATGLTRRIVAPLSRQGQELRSTVTEQAGPTISATVQHYTPGVLDAVDLDSVLDAVDLNALLARIDVDALLDRVGVDALLDRVGIDQLMARVDVPALLERVDLNALMAKVDLNALLSQVDLNALLSDVDMAALLDRIDINAVVEKVDIDSLVRNTELGAIIAQSTTGVASEALDVARSQGVSLDNVLSKVVDRVLRRDSSDLPAGPPLLVPQGTPTVDAPAGPDAPAVEPTEPPGESQ